MEPNPLLIMLERFTIIGRIEGQTITADSTRANQVNKAQREAALILLGGNRPASSISGTVDRFKAS